MTTEQKPIEYEQVTIKVPKAIMAFLRFKAGQQNISVEEEIEWDLLDDVRGEIEGFGGEDLISLLDAGRVFYEILGDEHYKPNKDC